MTGSPLISRPAPSASPDDSVLAGDGWWPDIDCTKMRDSLRIGEAITHARLIAALENAVIMVADDLADWRAAQEQAGHAKLDEVRPDQTVNGKPRLVVLFTNAVRYGAAAELADHSTDMSATATDQTRAEAKQAIACDYERRRLEAVRTILGTTRVAVELI